MRKLTKEEADKRDQLIYGRTLNKDEVFGGIANFGVGSYNCGTPINISIAEQLVENGWLDPEDCQNASPSAGEFMQFCKQYPQVKLIGYTVVPERDDCRTSIEGLFCDHDITSELITDFSNLCHDANEFEVNGEILYAWWD